MPAGKKSSWLMISGSQLRRQVRRHACDSRSSPAPASNDPSMPLVSAHGPRYSQRMPICSVSERLTCQLSSMNGAKVGERVGRARAAERAGARRAVAEQEVGDRVAGVLTVEREAAARRHLGEMIELAELRLNAEARIVMAFHPARRVGDAECSLGRALRDAALAIAAEAGHGEARTPVVDRIGAAGEVPQPDVADPVAAVLADRRVQMVGVVVAEARLVDDRRRHDPRLADRADCARSAENSYS